VALYISVPGELADSIFRVEESEAAGFLEAFVNIYRTTRHHIPEGCNLHKTTVENLISHIQ
jgi:hypothetical protein